MWSCQHCPVLRAAIFSTLIMIHFIRLCDYKQNLPRGFFSVTAAQPARMQKARQHHDMSKEIKVTAAETLFKESQHFLHVLWHCTVPAAIISLSSQQPTLWWWAGITFIKNLTVWEEVSSAKLAPPRIPLLPFQNRWMWELLVPSARLTKTIT